jgi:predicted dithiol-disulfide oxidoreductase (DUF899 family)
MSLPRIVSRTEWVAARKELLVEEKELTRHHDAVNADRRRLPMVRVEEYYTFEGPDGPATLLELFEDRLQLVVHHFMFSPDWELGCVSCSGFADQIGNLAHLNVRGTTLAAVSRAPITKITPFKQRMGWRFPWYSSHGSRFNYDHHVTLDESVMPLEHNYRSRTELEQAGQGPVPGPADQPFDLPGVSCFLRDGDDVFHTYSAYARGMDMIGFTTNLLDLTALGRQEEWEEPKGRSTGLGAGAGSAQLRYHDEYL